MASCGPSSSRRNATATKGESASEIEISSVVRDTAERTNNRTIIGGIKALFRKVAAVIVRRVADALRPKTKRRRSGDETRDAFAGMARKLMRRIERRPVYANAAIIMSETLDWLHVWHHHDNAVSGSSVDQTNTFDAAQNHLSPRL